MNQAAVVSPAAAVQRSVPAGYQILPQPRPRPQPRPHGQAIPPRTTAPPAGTLSPGLALPRGPMPPAARPGDTLFCQGPGHFPRSVTARPPGPPRRPNQRPSRQGSHSPLVPRGQQGSGSTSARAHCSAPPHTRPFVCTAKHARRARGRPRGGGGLLRSRAGSRTDRCTGSRLFIDADCKFATHLVGVQLAPKEETTSSSFNLCVLASSFRCKFNAESNLRTNCE